MNISVVIPTFNRAEVLPRAVESVLSQTLPAAEIIVVDDGSDDSTRALMASHFPQVKYFFQENAGVSAARNSGIKLAGSEWIALLDSDDEWQSQKLALQSEALRANPQFKICHSNEIWIRNGRRVNPMKKHKKYGGSIFIQCLPLCIISPSSVLIHRDIFDRYGLFDESLPACEDYDLWLRVCAFEEILYLDEKLVTKYGGHKDQLSHKHWGMDRFRIRALEKIISEPALNTEYRGQAVQVLREKLQIMLNGALKRKRSQKYISELQSKLDRLKNYD